MIVGPAVVDISPLVTVAVIKSFIVVAVVVTLDAGPSVVEKLVGTAIFVLQMENHIEPFPDNITLGLN